MTKPHHCVVLHSDPLAQLHLCVYLHANTLYRVVGIPRSRAALEAVFTKTTVDLILCGGRVPAGGAKAVRAELRLRGLPVVLHGTTTVQRVSHSYYAGRFVLPQ